MQAQARISFVLLFVLVCVASLLAVTGSKIDFTTGTTPGNPTTGKVRLWANSSTGNIECLTSTGASCLAGGIGTSFTPASDSTTAFQFFKANGTTQVLGIDTTNTQIVVGGPVGVAGNIRLALAGVSKSAGSGMAFSDEGDDAMTFALNSGTQIVKLNTSSSGYTIDLGANNSGTTGTVYIQDGRASTGTTLATVVPGAAQTAVSTLIDNQGTEKTIHLIGGGTGPTITSHFNTSGDSISGTDLAFRVTVGTGTATNTGTVTFGTAWTTAPVCVGQNETTLGNGVQVVPTTSTVVINGLLYSTGAAQNFTNGAVISVKCTGY